jgi:anti-anti-sigma factor
MSEQRLIAFRNERLDGDVTLCVVGEIDMATADEFADRLHTLIAAAHSPAFVDLSEVRFLDSSGINALAGAARIAAGAGVNLVLLAPSAPVRRALTLSGLARAFEVRS